MELGGKTSEIMHIIAKWSQSFANGTALTRGTLSISIRKFHFFSSKDCWHVACCFAAGAYYFLFSCD